MAEVANNTAKRKQRPALIIGLGGTGKQVLLNLRRMFYERYGQATLPHIGNLWIDTDTRNVTLDGQEMDFLMRQVDFAKSEKVETELSKDSLRNYYDHPEAHPEVFTWFDRRLEGLGEIRDGAGGIRGFGRLSFFSHYERIMEKLREKKEELGRAENKNLARENFSVELEGDTEYWLVFSVAGGTGAGMFLDMAFALKTQLQATNIRAVIVLPSVFSNRFQDKYFGNAYAALMELEHYSAVKDATDARHGMGLHEFNAAWTREMFQAGRGRTRGPVFDTAYLIGNQPRGGKGSLTLADKNALCQMISEMLYIEYTPSPEANALAPALQSKRSNFATVLNRVYSYENAHEGLRFREPFACRYSSFGLSKLHIPIHRIESLIHYRLARDFVDSWTREQRIPENLDDLLERTILHHKIMADNGSKYRDFPRALETSADGKTLTNQVRELLWSEKRSRIANDPDSARIRSGILNWVEELNADKLDNTPAVRNRWGTLAQSLAQSKDTHLARVLKGLDDVITDILAQPGQRFDVARELLRRIRDRLLKDKERLESAATNSRNSSNRYMRDAQTLLGWLDGLKPGFTRKVVVDVALENVEGRLIKELQAQILIASAQLCEQVANAIGVGQKATDSEGKEVVVETGLLSQLADYRKRLRDQVGSGLRERYDALGRIERSPINQDLGNGIDEVDRFYVDAHGKKIVENTIVELEQRFFEEGAAGSAKSLWDLRTTLSDDGARALIERLVQFARTSMTHLARQRVDVLERLADDYPPESTDYRAAVENLLGYAEPWLASPTHFVDSQDKSPPLDQALWISATAGVNTTNLDHFRRIVTASTARPATLVGGSPDRVYAYSEIAGLPLMVVPDLIQYRNEAYFPLLEEGQVLHTDLEFEKFRDLMIMERGEVADYVNALETLLKAILLRVVQAKQQAVEQKGDLVTYHYRTTSGLHAKTTDLGAFSVAVRSLARKGDSGMRDAIQAECTRLIHKMDDDPLHKWYALLDFHARNPDSFFARFSEGHIVRVILAKEADGCLARGGIDDEEARQQLANMRGQDGWAKEQPSNSGLYTFPIDILP